MIRLQLELQTAYAFNDCDQITAGTSNRLCIQRLGSGYSWDFKSLMHSTIIIRLQLELQTPYAFNDYNQVTAGTSNRLCIQRV